jgi:hypothetical protein
MVLVDDVTICTTTILRNKCIQQLLKSLKNIKNKIIIIDQNEEPIDISKYDLDILHVHAPDCGIGTAHNVGSEYANTKYMLWVDDDIIFNNMSLRMLYNVMENHDELGWVGGRINNNVGNNLEIKNNILYKIPANVNFFTFLDQPINAASIWKRNMYNDVEWAEEPIVGWLHEMVALDILDTYWRTASEPFAIFEHRPFNNPEYNKMRWRTEPSIKYLKKKYNIDNISWTKPRKTYINQ